VFAAVVSHRIGLSDLEAFKLLEQVSIQ